jgi:hypothetical protein
MDTLTLNDLRQLASTRSGPCVSLYLPTHPGGAGGEADAIELRGALSRAEEALRKRGLNATEAANALRQGRGLAENHEFWRERSNSLAIFSSPDVFRAWRLPEASDAVALVANRFYLKRLLPAVDWSRRCFVLTLSQNSVRLFEASKSSISETPIESFPANIDETLNYTSVDRGEQVHSAMRGGGVGTSSGGKQAAVFHGQGGEPDAAKSDLLLFFREIDRLIRPALQDETTPLLLAGVRYLLPIYREANTYPHLAEEEIHGNMDRLSDKEIHELVAPILHERGEHARKDVISNFRRLAGTGKTSDDATKVFAAAAQGRVQSLLLRPLAEQLWGLPEETGAEPPTCDAQTPGAEELTEWALAETIACGGSAYFAATDEANFVGPMAAIFRY